MCRRTSSNTRKFPKNTIDDKIVTPVTRSKNHKNHDFLTFFAYFRLNLKGNLIKIVFKKVGRPPLKFFKIDVSRFHKGEKLPSRIS